MYQNSFVGEIDNFSGEEFILKNDCEIYKARYTGGLTGQRE